VSYFPTPFRHLAEWRVDPRDPRPDVRAREQIAIVKEKGRRR
jgi:hypothetical protein